MPEEASLLRVLRTILYHTYCKDRHTFFHQLKKSHININTNAQIQRDRSVHHTQTHL